MARLGHLALALPVAACSGEVITDNLEGLSPEEQVALSAWQDKAFPVFDAKCMTCHNGSMPDTPGYLAGTTGIDKHDTLMAFMPTLVNLGAPRSSVVLNKGMHTGPALEATEASDILTWIEAEALAHPVTMVLRTSQQPMMLCTAGAPGTPSCPINTFDLGGLGVAATFEVVVTQLGADSYLSDMKFKAGADGLHVEHPLFESWPMGATMPTTDPIDRFFAIVINIAANAEAPLGTGETTLKDFAATDPMSIRFDIIEKQRL